MHKAKNYIAKSSKHLKNSAASCAVVKFKNDMALTD